jgi:hypothetical protein
MHREANTRPVAKSHRVFRSGADRVVTISECPLEIAAIHSGQSAHAIHIRQMRRGQSVQADGARCVVHHVAKIFLIEINARAFQVGLRIARI